MFTFSSANYLSEFLERTPALILPIIIINQLNPESAAYYYIDITIAGFLFMIPEAISNSFFAESSANESQLSHHLTQVIKAFLVFVIPAVIITFLLGNYLLLFFGHDYSQQGFTLLRILVISTIFIVVNSVFNNLVRIKYQIKKLIFINALGAITILSLSYLFSQSLPGIGWAWLIGQAVISLAYLTTTSWYNRS